MSHRVAIIGAGMSGLTCARSLIENGYSVTLFEKSRGVGGRISVRREEDHFQFDHGAQYFTVRDERFAAVVSDWVARGVAEPWQGEIAILLNGYVKPREDTHERFVGVPAMNSVCKLLAEGLDIRLQTRVSPPVREGDVWKLFLDSEEALPVELGQFEEVIITTPSVQAAELLAGAPSLARLAKQVKMRPCWTLLLVFAKPLELPYAGAFVHSSPLAWIACNSSKPQRNSTESSWVLQASPEWSAEHLEDTSEAVASELLRAFWQATRHEVAQPIFSTAHRWRYAIPVDPLAASYLYDSDLRVGACGDWCAGPRVEGAFLSGLAMAERIITGKELFER